MPESKMLANCWIWQGNSYTTNNFVGFLEDTLSKLSGTKVGLVHADSGFYGKELFDYLENGRPERLNYIIAAKFYQPIKVKLASQQVWMKLGEGIEIAETEYQGLDWEKPRRMVHGSSGD